MVALVDDADPYVRSHIALNPTIPMRWSELLTDPELAEYANPYSSVPRLRALGIERADEAALDGAPLPRPYTPVEAAEILILALSID